MFFTITHKNVFFSNLEFMLKGLVHKGFCESLRSDVKEKWLIPYNVTLLCLLFLVKRCSEHVFKIHSIGSVSKTWSWMEFYKVAILVAVLKWLFMIIINGL